MISIERKKELVEKSDKPYDQWYPCHMLKFCATDEERQWVMECETWDDARSAAIQAADVGVDPRSCCDLYIEASRLRGKWERKVYEFMYFTKGFHTNGTTTEFDDSGYGYSDGKVSVCLEKKPIEAKRAEAERLNPMPPELAILEAEVARRRAAKVAAEVAFGEPPWKI